MKNSTLRVKTETFVERANSWQEYYDIGHQLGEMGGLIRRMAMHMADLQKKVDRQATELKRQNIGWIPCSERLPEEETDVLVQWGEHRDMSVARIRKGQWHIHGIFLQEISNPEVITAWMPLPEPYKGETE